MTSGDQVPRGVGGYVFLVIALMTMAIVAGGFATGWRLSALENPPATQQTLKLTMDDAKRDLASAEIINTWLEHNVCQGETKGMKVHVEFKVHGMERVAGYYACYFYDSEGNAVFSSLDGYCTQDNHLSVERSFVPLYEHTHYTDETVFIPYSALPNNAGDYGLNVVVFSGSSAEGQVERQLAVGECQRFTMTIGE